MGRRRLRRCRCSGLHALKSFRLPKPPPRIYTIPQVLELKERANAIFKLGRYEHALGLYQEAIRLACAEVESTVDQGVLL